MAAGAALGVVRFGRRETATQWFGYFEGAATAGERAAEEIVKTWL
jgi:monoamine oxidase